MLEKVIKVFANILLCLIPVEIFTWVLFDHDFLDIILRHFGIANDLLDLPFWLRMVGVILWIMIVVRYSSIFKKMPDGQSAYRLLRWKTLIFISIIVAIIAIIDAFAYQFTGYSFLNGYLKLTISNGTRGVPLWIGIILVVALIVMLINFKKIFVYAFDDEKDKANKNSD